MHGQKNIKFCQLFCKAVARDRSGGIRNVQL